MQRTNTTILVTYSLKCQIKGLPSYQFTQCGKLFNCKTGRIKKQCLNVGSYGYWIGRKFYTLRELRDNLEKITQETCPF